MEHDKGDKFDLALVDWREQPAVRHVVGHLAHRPDQIVGAGAALFVLRAQPGIILNLAVNNRCFPDEMTGRVDCEHDHAL